MKDKVVTFGELLMRLSPLGHKRFLQAEEFDVIYGGAEANVAIALCVAGFKSTYVTKLPQTEIAEAGINFVRSFGVDTEFISRGGPRLGLYYIDRGASLRGSKVTYDRVGSSFALAKKTDFDWEKIFADAKIFHLTGITPALSDDMAQICIEACKEAKKLGVTVSFDVNYRASLWPIEKARKTLTEISKYVDVCFANEEEIREVYDINIPLRGKATDLQNHEAYEKMVKLLMQKFPFAMTAVTLLDSPSSSNHIWGGLLYDNKGAHYSRVYNIETIDRVGVGDAFSAGLIGAILKGYTGSKAIEYGTAAAALKFTVEGDCNLVSDKEIEALSSGGNAEIKR